jgi:hypothetical protein
LCMCACMQLPDVCLFAFIHSDLSQVEQLAALCTDAAHVRVFLYSFNTAYARVDAYFRRLGPHVTVATMTIGAVIDGVKAEAAVGRRVVMVTPASPNYEFGGQQLRVLHSVRRAFPSVVADVFSVGHCLFG